MKQFQDTVLEQMEQIAKKAGCHLVQTQAYANTGEVLAQSSNSAFDGPFRTAARAAYSFSAGHNLIRFNGESTGPTDMSWLFKEHEDDKINGMLRKWGQLVREGKR